MASVLCIKLNNQLGGRHFLRRVSFLLLGVVMKKRNVTKNNLALYRKLEESYKMDDTRYYGLFLCGKDKNGHNIIKIDPVRFSKKAQRLTKEQLDVINKRQTHYFIPAKYDYYDYNCNIFVREIEEVKRYWREEFVILIDEAVERVEKPTKVDVCDYHNFMCGISGPNGANAWAKWENMMRENEYRQKKFMTLCNLYAQFFHYMASRVEAITVYVLARNGKDVKNLNRNALYDFAGATGTARDFEHHKYHDKLYLIWHFIKHNSMSTYENLKANYPEVLVENEFKQGHMAMSYLKFSKELVIELLDGCAEFFKEYCDCVYGEKYDEAQWNYVKYFEKPVYDEIEMIENPLGLTVFDEMD